MKKGMALFPKLFLLPAIKWLILMCLFVQGCASSRPHVRLYKGDVLTTNEVAKVRIGEGAVSLKCEGEKLTPGRVGELLPGKHEITVEGKWFTNIQRATLAPFVLSCTVCATIPVWPLLPSCAGCLPLLVVKPSKICDCNTTIDVSAGKAYEMSIDWSGMPPTLCVKETEGNTPIATVECVLRE